MSITNTVLIFVVAPLAIIAVIATLTLLGGGRRTKRYRPGRPYDFTPIWFLSTPEQVTGGERATGGAAEMYGEGSSAVAGTDRPAVGGTGRSPETGGAQPLAGAGSTHPPALRSGVVETGGRVPQGATGGASDRW